MKVVTLEVVLIVDEDFDEEESGTFEQIVDRALDYSATYDSQAMLHITEYGATYISERTEDEDD